VSEALIDRLAKSGHKTISIAPEAGSERLRRLGPIGARIL
jgi:radical SAM superfamily enzyme YgiQ (UPF0313 family)